MSTSFSCLCQHEIREKACARALREPLARCFPAAEGFCLEKCPGSVQTHVQQPTQTQAFKQAASQRWQTLLKLLTHDAAPAFRRFLPSDSKKINRFRNR